MSQSRKSNNIYTAKQYMKRILCLMMLALPAVQLLAWGATGHRIVAQIAYDHLNAFWEKGVLCIGPIGRTI